MTHRARSSDRAYAVAVAVHLLEVNGNAVAVVVVVLTVRRDAVVIVVFILAIWDAVAVAVHLLEVVGFRRRRRRCLAVRDAVAVVS